MQGGLALARIGYSGATEPSLAVLAELQRAFLLTVPFENLDIHLGREIVLDPDAVYAKIVEQRRGGFCYECNGLFHDLLTELGFTVHMSSARMVKGTQVGPEFDHMVLVVELDGTYLVDVGNGRSCREPLRLDGGNESSSEGLLYRVREHDGFLALMVKEPGASWRPRYLFDATPRRREEFVPMCRHTQLSPESIFTQGRLVTLATESGRMTLSEMLLEIVEAGRSELRTLGSDQEYRTVLQELFGIELDPVRDRWRWHDPALPDGQKGSRP